MECVIGCSYEEQSISWFSLYTQKIRTRVSCPYKIIVFEYTHHFKTDFSFSRVNTEIKRRIDLIFQVQVNVPCFCFGRGLGICGERTIE